jgi:hypothetical protein
MWREGEGLRKMGESASCAPTLKSKWLPCCCEYTSINLCSQTSLPACATPQRPPPPDLSFHAALLDEETYTAQLRRCLFLASRTPAKSVADVAGAAYLYLLRLPTPGAEGLAAAAAQSVQSAVADFFTKKRSRLQLGLVKEVCRRRGAGALLSEVLKHAAKGRSEFLRVQALELLESVLKVNLQGGVGGRGYE